MVEVPLPPSFSKPPHLSHLRHVGKVAEEIKELWKARVESTTIKVIVATLRFGGTELTTILGGWTS